MKKVVILRLTRFSLVALLLLGILAVPQGPARAAPNTPINGDFEQGAGVGWQETTTSGTDVIWNSAVYGGPPTHGGTWLAFLGGIDSETETISQTLTIAPNTQMNFWYRLISTYPCGASVGRVLFNATVLKSWALCSANVELDWTLLTLDLSAFAGQTGTLQFYVNTTTGNYSSLHIDDVLIYDTFVDLAIDDPFLPYIKAIYNDGITSGCSTSPLMYCPNSTVTRAQMAVFLLRGIHGSSYNPPAVGGATGFGDVPTTYWAAAWVKQLAAEGITGGCGSGNYCPEAPVTRAQMAVFLLRSKYGAAYSPPAVGSSSGFGDVPTTYWAAAWIKQLVTEGITSGCGAGIYCPESPVTRGQMAVFLSRTFGIP
jgi:hypothetical protein